MKHPKNSISGVALVIVLGFLVIISGLAVAFFSSINTEMKASRNFAAGITTRQLADSAVQIVMGQISSATTRGIDSQGMGHEVWASQPGMIRVYGVNAGGTYIESAAADAFFKLYSSDQMLVTTTSNGGPSLAQFNPETDYLTTWDAAPALWTDLNAPVIVRDTTGQPTPRFPIIDPRAYAFTYNAGGSDPWANDIEGFSYDASGGIDGVVGPKNTMGGDNTQRLPMPVKWIYVLQDGTLTTPGANGTTIADFASALPNKQPTAQNPIVGRIAFWTDDETCKLNLNTAAGYSDRNISQLNQAYKQNPSAYAGSYWDTPRFYTQFDYGIPTSTGTPAPNQASGGLAICQLLQFEFQRYPGHPATTSLAPILDTLVNSEQIYDLVPRYTTKNLQGVPGSTQGGTQRVIVDPYAGIGAAPPTTPPNPNVNNTLELQPKQDRLYATPDEFLFGAHVTGIPSTSPSYVRETNNLYAQLSGSTYSPISPQVIDRLRFFMTTQGRSPELNAYGQPRITAWPVRAENSSEPSGLNVYDNLILFCSTIGAANATGARPDSINDSQAMQNGAYRYIFTRREVGAGMVTNQPVSDVYGSHPRAQFFGATYTPDWKRVRNSYLLQNYLYGSAGDSSQPGLTNRKIPGNGSSFSDKYSSSDRQGILTEIFDYILLANSQDTTTSIGTGQTIKFAPLGYVPPSMPDFFKANGVQAKGFGRMSTICEASLVFYYAGPQMDNINTSTDTTNPLIPKGSAPNTGWSHWDPANRSARYVKVGKDKANDPTHYGRVLGGYMRAFMLFSMFDPMQGYAPKSAPGDNDPKISIEATWQNDFSVAVNPQAPSAFTNLGFPVGTPVSTTIHVAPGTVWGGRNYGGYEGFAHTLQGAGTTLRPYKTMWAPGIPLNNASPALGGDYGETYMTSGTTGVYTDKNFTAFAGNIQEYYPFQTNINTGGTVFVDNDLKVFGFHGGNVTVKLYYGGSQSNQVAPALQTINLTFPSSTNPWPVPQGAPQAELNAVVKDATPKPAQPAPTPDVSTWLAMPRANASFGPDPVGVNPAPGGLAQGMRSFYWTGNGCFFANMAVGARAPIQSAYRGAANFETSLQASWSFATRNAWVSVGNGDSYNPHTNGSGSPIDPGWYGDRWRNIVQPGDTIRSLLYWDGHNASQGQMRGADSTTGGDLRIAAISSNVQSAEFQPHPDYLMGYSRACVLRGGDGNPYFPVGSIVPLVSGSTGQGGSPAVVYAVPTDSTKEATLGNHIFLGNGGAKMQPTRAFGNLPWGGGVNLSATAGVNGVKRREPQGGGVNWGDFDTGLGDFPDGPFCNKQDEGNVIYRYWDSNIQQYVYPIPYFTGTQSYQAPGNVFTSPCRQMPSPAMFGSLPSYPSNGGKGGLDWTTLAFSPNTAGPDHPGNKTEPKDHYLLDLFSTPVVEPYPISEPFSTAGKVNLNYRIVPFDYIRRSTALRGALYPLRITAVSSGALTGGNNYLNYKIGQPAGQPLTQNFRLRLDRDETIKAFDGYFDAQPGNPDVGFFKVASQICERWLYPKDGTTVKYAGSPNAETTTMQDWWSKWGDLTGDNEREKPYVDLYPRITTKSNTFTVHMKVQTLRQTPGHPLQWYEGKDAVLAEYRGSATIERYIDPADARFSPANVPTFNPDKQSVEPMYRFRTVVSKKFTQ
ncbi:hypothetical protein CfE428DRAFT_6609 [Chthoniobacter flavus Ellin428]|uniref:Verru_Chthon cassette protein A n=1 Tax=Chthoniobacter flavus Ellin428 TaxID=497964 RepID=B4DCG8_9BACT|nr:Verru_Chthon cassette protein A [Chthoniobacter flavus]EDY15877.1 hypothetical protein CfE428DRAFT_6609 [Chthoniobacter flavus Ellin428]